MKYLITAILIATTSMDGHATTVLHDCTSTEANYLGTTADIHVEISAATRLHEVHAEALREITRSEVRGHTTPRRGITVDSMSAHCDDERGGDRATRLVAQAVSAVIHVDVGRLHLSHDTILETTTTYGVMSSALTWIAAVPSTEAIHGEIEHVHLKREHTPHEIHAQMTVGTDILGHVSAQHSLE